MTKPMDTRLPTRLVSARYNISDRTVARWERDPNLNFPKALIINKRKYFAEDELTAWDRANASRLTAA
jgi:hypothetical protein